VISMLVSEHHLVDDQVVARIGKRGSPMPHSEQGAL